MGIDIFTLRKRKHKIQLARIKKKHALNTNNVKLYRESEGSINRHQKSFFRKFCIIHLGRQYVKYGNLLILGNGQD